VNKAFLFIPIIILAFSSKAQEYNLDIPVQYFDVDDTLAERGYGNDLVIASHINNDRALILPKGKLQRCSYTVHADSISDLPLIVLSLLYLEKEKQYDAIQIDRQENEDTHYILNKKGQIDGPLHFTQKGNLVYCANFKNGKIKEEKKLTLQKADFISVDNILGTFTREDGTVNPSITILNDGTFNYSAIVGCTKKVEGKGSWKIEDKMLKLMNPAVNLPGDLSFTTMDFNLFGKKLYPNVNGFINPYNQHYIFKKKKGIF